MGLEDYKNAQDLGKTDIRGQRISDSDLQIFIRGESEVVFGTNPNDNIEVALYDESNNLLRWSLKDPSQPIADTGDRQRDGFADELILDPSYDIHELGYGEGRYKISYSFLQNIFGSADTKERAYISEISPSRTEIRILPLVVGDTDKDQLAKSRFQEFKNVALDNTTWISIINTNFTNDSIQNIISAIDPLLLDQYLSEFGVTSNQLELMLTDIKDSLKTELTEYIVQEEKTTYERFHNLFLTVLSSQLASRIPDSSFNEQEEVVLVQANEELVTLEDLGSRVNQTTLEINVERIDPVIEWTSENFN